jgi:hypothetical protein
VSAKLLFVAILTVGLCPLVEADETLTTKLLNHHGTTKLVITRGPVVDTVCSHYKFFESDSDPENLAKSANDLFVSNDQGEIGCAPDPEYRDRVWFTLKPGKCMSPDRVYYVKYDNHEGSKGLGQFQQNYQIVSPRVYHTRNEFQIVPSACLDGVRKDDVTVVQTEKIIKNGKAVDNPTPEGYPVDDIGSDGDRLLIKLARPLPDAQTTSIKVTIKLMNAAKTIEVDGTVTVPDAPANDNDAKLIVNLSGTSAVDSGPVYSGTGTLALLHPADRAVGRPKLSIGTAYLDPTATFDLGSKSSGSANSITGSVPLKWEYAPTKESADKEGGAGKSENTRRTGSADDLASETKRKTGIADKLQEASRKPLSSLSLSAVCGNLGLMPHTWLFSAGPKAEIGTVIGAEQVLNRETLLFEGTVEAHPCLLDWSRANKQALYAAALSDADYNLLRAPAFGFQLTPYFTFDGGSSLFDQTVSDKATSTKVTVPSQGIARVYFGFRGEWEFPLWKFPSSITFDETGFYLAKTERIAFDDAKGAQIRSVSGLQPHSSLGLNLYFGQSQHYALTISYEDGRSAPSFEYLNKVQYGVKIKF